MSKPLIVAAAVWLTACAGGPVPPQWQANTHTALAAHSRAYLLGDDRVAAQELHVARREAARTGAAEPLARVELTACALQTASLSALDECAAMAPLAPDLGPDLHAYAAYLTGRWAGLDARLLPEAQRNVPAAPEGAGAVAVLAAIADPLSRLVAAAGLLRAGRLPPAGIALAIDTASAQGWRRPLLAWLRFERQRLEQAGDAGSAAVRQRQIDRVLSSVNYPLNR